MKSSRIDLGLALCGALLKPGQRLTREDIAAWCDCSGSMIWIIEQQALKKVRKRLKKLGIDSAIR